MKKFLSTFLVITIIFMSIPSVIYAEGAGSYSNAELERAVKLGFGAFMPSNPAMTFSQFFKMLDRTVELADPSKLD